MTLTEFITALDARFADYAFSFTQGAKFTRVIISDRYNSRSVFCFVDAEGNILKPASWKTPAKGIRSTLVTVDVTKVDQFGSWLYRRG